MGVVVRTPPAAEAASAADDARAAAVRMSYSSGTKFVRECRRDYEAILELHGDVFREMGGPIEIAGDLGPLGPLWSAGEPEWFQGDDDDPDRRAIESEPEPLEVYLDPGEAPEELLTEFFVALSAVYRAHGGSGLKVIREQRRTFAGEVL